MYNTDSKLQIQIEYMIKNSAIHNARPDARYQSARADNSSAVNSYGAVYYIKMFSRVPNIEDGETKMKVNLAEYVSFALRTHEFDEL